MTYDRHYDGHFINLKLLPTFTPVLLKHQSLMLITFMKGTTWDAVLVGVLQSVVLGKDAVLMGVLWSGVPGGDAVLVGYYSLVYLVEMLFWWGCYSLVYLVGMLL